MRTLVYLHLVVSTELLTLELRRTYDLYGHDWFQDDGFCFGVSFTESANGTVSKCQFRGVDNVVGTIS
jgi:hypothetical protein